MIFVFGSNLAGRHGKGAAKFALDNHGAIYGQGEGFQGNSYAIPTKDENLKPLPLQRIDWSIRDFTSFALENPRDHFALTPIGCGLAGNKKRDIWAMLKSYSIPCNVYLTSTWVTE
mgnify:CR=1 FL=1|tara:strand:- start:300 stop:647 length:348 start_codon:yes stop_codon:yes gene_type:complete